MLLTQVAPSQPATQRLTAAKVIGGAGLGGDELTALVDVVKTAGPLELDSLLAAFEQTSDASIGLKLIAALKDSKALPALRADGLRQRLAKFPPEVQQAAEPLFARLSPDAAKQKARLDGLLATLPTGDARGGQAIFNSTKAACASCHSIGYVGGNIGPDLTRIGQIRQRRDLLESIVYPSASFAQSYEPMIVDTVDGDRQSGILRKNDAQEIVLITGPTQEVHIPRANVKEIRPGTLSIMPEGLDQQLTPQELSDLVTFLLACK
jgi:putative heme-binding domain-containing protein